MSGLHIDMSEVVKLARDLGLAAQLMPLATEEALNKAGEMVQTEARSAAPVLTGALRDSVYLHRSKLTRRIGTPLIYGLFQEFGTSKMAPHPWLFDAGEKGREELAKGVLEAAKLP